MAWLSSRLPTVTASLFHLLAMPRIALPTLVLASWLTLPASAQASALDGWDTAGDVALAGDHTVVLTTAYDAFDDAPGSVLVGLGAIAAQQVGGLEERAGLAIGALDTTVGEALHQATEGSVISRTFTVTPGATLSFRWQLLSNEDARDGLPDLAFLSLGGQLIELGTPAIADFQGFAGFERGSGWLSFSHTFDAGSLGGGETSLRLSLGVVDRGDTSTSTALAIQNVTVSAVPEPATWGLVFGGLLASLVTRRSRSRA